MSIILPDVPDGHVWITSPGWMFDHYHWAWFLGVGIFLLALGLVMRRVDGRSFATGFAIVISLGPLGLGLVGGAMAGFFWGHPRTMTAHETWSLHDDANHSFRIPQAHLDGDFGDPDRAPGSDRATINRDLASAFSLQVLQPTRDAVFVRSDATDAELSARANKAPAYLIDDQVYSCVFLTTGITSNAKNQIIEIDVTAAQCLQGERSVRFTLH